MFRLWKAIVSGIACLFASTPSGRTRSPHLPPRPCHRQSFNRYRNFDGRLPPRTHCSRACSVLTSSRPWSRLAKPFSAGEPRWNRYSVVNRGDYPSDFLYTLSSARSQPARNTE